MRCCVITSRRAALFNVDLRDNHISNLQCAVIDSYLVHYQSADRRKGVDDCYVRIARSQRSSIANLSARFGVKRCAVEDCFAFVTFVQGLNLIVILNKREDVCAF